MSRVLCLDVGDRRIGVAISDELGFAARGLFTLKRSNIKTDTEKIIDTAAKNNCSCIVIGLPLNTSGEDSVQTAKVRIFAAKLQNKLISNRLGDVKVELYDERYSTVIAAEQMKEAGVRLSRQEKLIDQQAAAVILMDWLRETGQGHPRREPNSNNDI